MLILYAEDDIEDFDFFSEILQEFNPKATALNAVNGLQAIEILQELTVLPNAVFLDVNMPTMDGKACLKALKGDETLKAIPVYVYSTGVSPRDIEQCMQLGAAAVITKPLSLDEARTSLGKVFAQLD
ncbi:response regulator [Parachryseolinea silvisoli]|uniref:response regulator n=1 Tax=Parachryseolinea silvisoli TaxID=2873601 RepID=UPI0022658453|nr:response regulator [Parachryseolinea silvisoli]MCD9017676.1 response regulator [Parachryseolinea silvisoli]